MNPPLTIDEIEQWVAFGATWRLVEISDQAAVLEMCQCTGELADLRVATDPVVLEYLRNHPPADA